MPDNMRVFRQARDKVAAMLQSDHAHTVYIGYDPKKGMCVVVEVGQKMSIKDVLRRGLTEVPETVKVLDGTGKVVEVPTDVHQQAQSRILLLDLEDGDVAQAQAHRSAEVFTEYVRGCVSCPIPGGVQIQTEGTTWVGTLGAGLWFERYGGSRPVWGAVTNAHVAVPPNKQKGRARVCQPEIGYDPEASAIGFLDRWSTVTPGSNIKHTLDVAFIECFRDDGDYAPGTYTVMPKVAGPVEHRAIHANVATPRLGDSVSKVGRTTGKTDGVCVGLEATARVSYGAEGTALFVDQLVVRSSADGAFSAPGDSGALVFCEAPELKSVKPWGLLFAGGGETSLVNPIAAVLDSANASFFS